MNESPMGGVKTRGATSRLLLLSYIKTHEKVGLRFAACKIFVPYCPPEESCYLPVLP